MNMKTGSPFPGDHAGRRETTTAFAASITNSGRENSANVTGSCAALVPPATPYTASMLPGAAWRLPTPALPPAHGGLPRTYSGATAAGADPARTAPIRSPSPTTQHSGHDCTSHTPVRVTVVSRVLLTITPSALPPQLVPKLPARSSASPLTPYG